MKLKNALHRYWKQGAIVFGTILAMVGLVITARDIAAWINEAYGASIVVSSDDVQPVFLTAVVILAIVAIGTTVLSFLFLGWYTQKAADQDAGDLQRLEKLIK